MTGATTIWRRYWRLLLPLMLAPAIAWLFDVTPLDKAVTALYYDAATHSFPLRDDLFMQTVLHSGLRLVVIAVAVGVLGAFLLSFVIPQWEAWRRRLLWIFAGIAGSTAMVSLLKRGSAMHCPWDLTDYGGYAPFHRLLDSIPANVAAGHCFPGGHAASGFALMAFYFALRDAHPRPARIALVTGIVAGMAMGWVQIVRGAHFLSHNVWAGWMVWLFLALMYHLVPPQRAV